MSTKRMLNVQYINKTDGARQRIHYLISLGPRNLPFASARVHPRFVCFLFFFLCGPPCFFSGLCCHIMCLYVLSSVLCCWLRFPHKSNVRFVFISSCLVVSNTYCVVFLCCFSSFCVPYVSSFWIVLFWLPLRYSLAVI